MSTILSFVLAIIAVMIDDSIVESSSCIFCVWPNKGKAKNRSISQSPPPLARFRDASSVNSQSSQELLVEKSDNSDRPPAPNPLNPPQSIKSQTTPPNHEEEIQKLLEKSQVSDISEWTVLTEGERHVDQLFGLSPRAVPPVLFAPDAMSVNTDSMLKLREIIAEQRAINYDWKDFVFDKLELTEDRRVRNSMIVGIYLQILHNSVKQISDAMNSTIIANLHAQTQDGFKQYHIVLNSCGHLRDLLKSIPSLFRQGNMQEMMLKIHKSFESLLGMKLFLEQTLVLISTASDEEVIDHDRNTDDYRQIKWQENVGFGNKGRDTMLQTEAANYNAEISKANYSEELLNNYRPGKHRKFETHYYDLKSLTIASMKYLMTIQQSLQAILVLLTQNGKILFSQINAAAIPMMHMSVMKTMFPEINIQCEFRFYNKLMIMPSPVGFVRALGLKLFMHSRRTFFGKFHRNMNMRLAVRQIIRKDPFDIVFRVEITDNCPPIQLPQLEKLQTKIKDDYKKLLDQIYIVLSIERVFSFQIVEDNLEHRTEWQNDIFLLGAIISSEIDGTFGIINHYTGSGEIQDIQTQTRTIFWEFSILRENLRNITESDINAIEEAGMTVITEQNMTMNEQNMKQYLQKYEEK